MKYHVKKVLNQLFLLSCTSTFLFLTAVSCKGPCEKSNINCEIGGEEVVDSHDKCVCDCRRGFEGEFCKTVVRDKYIGAYSGSRECLRAKEEYGIKITSNENGIIYVNISNLYDQGFKIYAHVDSVGNLRIPSQTFGRGQISGTASIKDSSLTVDFAVSSEGGKTDDCQGNFDKK